MPLADRPWIVRVLAYAGTGILVLLLALVILAALVFLIWSLAAGPLWLRWTVGVQLLLILLTAVGRNFHDWREFW